MSSSSSGGGGGVAGNIVAEWLRSLRLGRYADAFLDNGYDDLEICKQIGEPDLDAIGVLHQAHRRRLLRSVRTLREEGAAGVYFTLDLVGDEDGVSVETSSSCSSVSANKEEEAAVLVPPKDEYEEGKAELVRIPRMRLEGMLKERLHQDGVVLSCLPYSTQDGDRGYLEGLASRYADLLSTHYVDVLRHLEDLRRLEWAETSTGVAADAPPPRRSPTHAPTPVEGVATTGVRTPRYAPGKYSPSSCLSDKEEDEIYGFGYGVFATQIARQQQQRLLGQQQLATSQQPLLLQKQQHNYQTCLSPRSAYFYEFPPNAEQTFTNTGGKKRTTFSRFLRGLKTSHRKEKHGGASSPRHDRAAARGVPQRVDTPDSVLQSGLGLTDLGHDAVLRSMVDPRDYDRLRHLQPNTFEETIYKLKLQEAMRKREKFTKEHEDILRDIKQGLLQLGKEGIRGPLSGDDTYMYDDDARMLAPPAAHRRPPAHWYDEPPYESDPDDFLMGGPGEGPTATYRDGRVCFSTGNAPRVISLRSAGDITLPRGDGRGGAGTPRRGLILPSQAGYPPAIIPLRSSRDRESGDYAGSDVQSLGSRLSGLSVDTSRSDPHHHRHLPPHHHHHHHHHRHRQATSPPRYYAHSVEGQPRRFRRQSGGYARSEDGISPGQSSDYEDQEEFSHRSQQIATVHVSGDARSAAGASGEVRGLREDVHRKMSRMKSEQIFQCSASSVESLPSGSGSSTQALVRAGSNHSSISTEEADPSPTDQIVGRARALVDQTPSPYDTEMLKFKTGDLIDIVSMNASGQWRGVCRGRRGTFKFIDVEPVSQRQPKRDVAWRRRDAAAASRPASVEELLVRLGLHDYISVFVLNGYEDLELFKELEPSDLDYLGIVDADHRSQLLAAVHFLHDLDSGSEGELAGSLSSGDEHRVGSTSAGDGVASAADSPFGLRRQFPRDSGCYDAPPQKGGGGGRQRLTSPSAQGESDTSDSAGFSETTRNNLDSVVEHCNNEILARVKQAQINSINLKEELSTTYQPNVAAANVIDTQQPVPNKPKDSYVGVHGQTSLVDPCRQPAAPPPPSSSSLQAGDEGRMASVGGAVDLMTGAGDHANGRGGCPSEKSSDSGVSSSSLSSAHHAKEALAGFKKPARCPKT